MASSSSSPTTTSLLLMLSLAPRHALISSSRFLISPSPLPSRSSPLLRSRPGRPRRFHGVVAAKFNMPEVIRKAWKIGKDGVEAGANLVPDAVPKPIARICVAGVTVTIALFLLKSILSTALFVLAMMGAIYFVFLAFNADEGPKGGGGSTISSEDETLEEARRIMDKYK